MKKAGFPIPTAEEAWNLPAGWWNRLVDFLRRNRPLLATGKKARGQIHPWKLAAGWDDDRGIWRAGIFPGFVNGRPAAVNLPAKLAPASTLRRLGDPKEGDVAALLTERPEIPLRSFRLETNPPAWFRHHFRFAPAPEFTAGGETITEKITGRPAGSRILRAVDVGLSLRRPFTRVEFDERGRASILTAGETARHAEITLSGRYAPPIPPSAEEILRGGNDGGRDSLQIGTIWLLSPADAPEDSEPDGTWTAYPQNRLFWNLNHATTPPRAVRDLVLPNLGAGTVGAGLIGQILTNQEAFASFQSVLAANQMEGRFWSI